MDNKCEDDALLRRWVADWLELAARTRTCSESTYQDLAEQLDVFCEQLGLDPIGYLPAHLAATLSLASNPDGICPMVSDSMLRCQKTLNSGGFHSGGHIFATPATWKAVQAATASGTFDATRFLSGHPTPVVGDTNS